MISIVKIILLWQLKFVAEVEFVKQYSWPELVPELRSAIQNSDQISNNANCKWRTVNALTVLHALIRPFQVLINFLFLVHNYGVFVLTLTIYFLLDLNLALHAF